MLLKEYMALSGMFSVQEEFLGLHHFGARSILSGFLNHTLHLLHLDNSGPWLVTIEN